MIIFIDISDIQDEAQYFRDSNGNVLKNSDTLLKKIKAYAKIISHYLRMDISQLNNIDLVQRTSNRDIFALERSEWTYNASSNAYGELGVNGAIEKAVLK